MLTTVSHNKEKGLKVVKHSHTKDPSMIFGYQVHNTKDTMNPLRERFTTKAEADKCIGVNQKKEPEKKSKRSK
jgi:hypothetical protein